MNQQGENPGAGSAGPGAGVNRGIIISGGNSGAVATGHARATAVTYSSDSGDPLEMIDRLLQQLEADAAMLEGEQAEDVIDDAHRLHTEVHSRRPSAESVRGLLSRLTKAAGSTATLLATVDQIKDLVTVLLH